MFHTIFHNNKDAFLKWHDDHAIIGTIIGILSFIAPTIISFVGNLPIWQSLMLFLLILVIFLVYFFNWKSNNFYLTKLDTDHLLIIERPTEKLFIGLNSIIIPSNDVLRLKITLCFDPFLKKELDSKGKYILAFKKPKNLYINYYKTGKTKYTLINDGISDTIYSIGYEFRNNNVDVHQFDLEADIETNGDLEIYLLDYVELQNIEDIIMKKSPIAKEKIFSTKITDNNQNC